MLTAEQSRAARGWLGLTQGELAERASVGLSTVRDLETGRRVISEEKLRSIRSSLEAAGVRFTYRADGLPQGIEVAS
ncbi:MAG: helix-turn-helix domain-containing protein [Janthinobacterium lividum]